MDIKALNCLYAKVASCQACRPLAPTAGQPAGCYGNVYSGVMVVTRRPETVSEIRDGMPDVEKLSCLTSLVKCRVEERLSAEAARHCLYYFTQELEIIRPHSLIAIGQPVYEQLFGVFKGEFWELHGKRNRFYYKGIEIIPSLPFIAQPVNKRQQVSAADFEALFHSVVIQVH